MLEAMAHQQLKALLQQEGLPSWPHQLTLGRLVGRSLRRSDHTLVRLVPGTDPGWLLGLLVPLALNESPVALVVSEALRHRLLQVEWPRLRAAGLAIPCWEGADAPDSAGLWLLSHRDLLQTWRAGRLGDRQLVIPEAEGLEIALRQALAVRIDPHHWDLLRRARPNGEAALLTLHQRLTERVIRHPSPGLSGIPLAPEDEAPLRQLLPLLDPLPDPWQRWLAATGDGWGSWARCESGHLNWHLHRQPLEPLHQLQGMLKGRGLVLVGELAGAQKHEAAAASMIPQGFTPSVVVDLGDPPLADPLPLYAPLRQPLPNSPHFRDHLLDHSRRLVLGQSGLTVILIEDPSLRKGLTSGLAAEFGSRVSHESTAPESNGVVCASWQWWLAHQGRLPLPCQIVVGLLPIASLEDPLTAARVAQLRRRGLDWFRQLLLPDALNRLQRGLAGLRRQGGRLAVLDGRLRSRSWGRQVFRALEPWVPLTRLLPD